MFGSFVPGDEDIPEGATPLFEVSRERVAKVMDFLDENVDLLGQITFPVYLTAVAQGMKPTAGRELASMLNDVLLVILAMPGVELTVVESLTKALESLPEMDLDAEFGKLLNPEQNNNHEEERGE